MFIIKVEKENEDAQYVFHVGDNIYGFRVDKEKALVFKTQQLAMDFITSMPRKYKDITTLLEV